jgi:DNA-binding transcriptional ArsR family regulator
MKGGRDVPGDELNGDELVRLLAALASPPRLRILAALTAHRLHVSELARDVQLSRPLVHAHLGRLTAAGLVSSSLELSGDGKALRYVEVVPFALRLTPDLIATAVQTLTAGGRAVTEEEDLL